MLLNVVDPSLLMLPNWSAIVVVMVSCVLRKSKIGGCI